MSKALDPADVLAVIPARGGSKGLPGKNLRRLGGQTLVTRALLAALESGVCGRVVLTTDADAIAMEAENRDVQVIRRPAALAADDSLTIDVVEHVLEQLARDDYRPKCLVLLQPTSPLRQASDVAAAVRLWHERQAASVISVTLAEHHPRKMLTLTDEGSLVPLYDRESLSAPRQTLPKVYRQNGAIYVCAVQALREARSFYLPPCWPYAMNKGSSIDIDDSFDLMVAEAFLTAI